MSTYTTRTEAIHREIVEPLEAGDVADARAEFDVEAIADAVLAGHQDGYRCAVSADEFWDVVARHAR